MKKFLIIPLSFLIGCFSFKPVSTMDNYQLQHEYLDLQYELSQIEQEYNNTYRPPVKRYKVTAERSDIVSFGYTKYELVHVYDYGHSNALALHNTGVGIDRKKAEKDIKRLKARISEVGFELTRRGLMP